MDFLVTVATAVAGDAQFFRMVLRRHGDDGVNTYRIPGLATTKAGTLIAVVSVRHAGSGDLPAAIVVGTMRGSDEGRTWGPLRTILAFNKSERESRGDGVGDPCVLVDCQNGTILVAALWSKGDWGWAKSGPGLSPDETGQLVVTKSIDDGRTWSEPINLTSQVKAPRWRLCFDDPGAGIQLRDGTPAVPAQFRAADGMPDSCFIWSADHGISWKISSPATAGAPPTNEAQIAQLADGSLPPSTRNGQHSGTCAWVRYEWSGDLANGLWAKPRSNVPDSTCMAGLVRHPSGVLLFSNPASSPKRVAMTVRATRDEGRTGNSGRVLEAGLSAYSCLNVLTDGRIGILYESGGPNARETLTFAAFSLEWVLPAGVDR